MNIIHYQEKNQPYWIPESEYHPSSTHKDVYIMSMNAFYGESGRVCVKIQNEEVDLEQACFMGMLSTGKQEKYIPKQEKEDSPQKYIQQKEERMSGKDWLVSVGEFLKTKKMGDEFSRKDVSENFNNLLWADVVKASNGALTEKSKENHIGRGKPPKVITVAGDLASAFSFIEGFVPKKRGRQKA